MINSHFSRTDSVEREEECDLLDVRYLQETFIENNILEICGESIPDFAEQQTGILLPRLREALHQEDENSIQQLVHKFVGLSGLYGAQRLQILLDKIELAVTSHDFKQAETILDEIEIVVRRTISALVLCFADRETVSESGYT